MALPPQFLDELRARTPLPAVIGRRVRLSRSGRQWKGCCPFHGEKTPSFYVYDDHYHCFGCGAHGDAIGFVMQSQGAGFTEAVEQLAAEAGLDVPKPTPEAAEAERRRVTLHGVLDAASNSFQRRLRLPEGRAALDYLHRRGLSDETIARFGLGWSGEGRGSLLADLSREGITQPQLVEAGLIRHDDETGRSFDLFFNRVMFPIRDRRGRTISFGGRVLGDGQPKYVNGPETALFSKRRNLYGLDLAREAVKGGETLVVVEGYMDVIALAQAGHTAAVAPLGTALTEEQLEELWRLSPAPILCFDGDGAGARAAARAADLALPMLAPDRTLKLATLPSGEDPDSLTRRQGAAGFTAVLAAARPLSDALYDYLKQGGADVTPEQRAAFRTRLEEAARRIPDRALASEYRRAMLDRFYADRPNATRQYAGSGVRLGGAYRIRGAPRRGPQVPRPQPAAEGSSTERIRILTAILLRHPALLHEVEHAYAELQPPLSIIALRNAICDALERIEPLDSGTLIDHLTKSGFQQEIEYALATVPVPLPACAAANAMPAEALSGWWHIYGFLNVDRLRQEVAAAQDAFARNMVPENQTRHKALAEALNKVLAGEPDGADTVAA
jgi:DNA primase